MQRIADVCPIEVRPQRLAPDNPGRFPLQLHTEPFPDALARGASFSEVTDRGAALDRELGLSVGVETVKVDEQCVHARSIPKGNQKSIPFSRLPLSMEFGQWGMDTQTHRKLRLRELIDATCSGVIATFAARIGRDDSYVARMLYPADKAGAKPIADKLMLAIEKAFNLPRAWLDLPLGSPVPAQNADNPSSFNVAERGREYLPNVAATSTAWPFERVTPVQFGSLSTAQKYHIEDTIFVLLGVGQEAPDKSGFKDRRVANS